MSLAAINNLKYLLDLYCRDCTLVSRYGVSFNTTKGLSQNTFDNNAHRFAFDYVSIDITGTREQREMATLIDAMKAGSVNFYWKPPDLFFAPLGNPTSNPVILADVNPNSNQVQIGANNTSGNFLSPGDLIKFDNHDKVYRILNIEQQVNPVVTLNTGLVKGVTTAEQMITTNVEVYVKFDTESSDSFEYARQAGDFDSSFEFRLIEV